MNDGIGTITPPEALDNFGPVQSGGLGNLLNLFLNILIVGGGIYALFNFILAGYTFLSAGGDAKKVEQAWAKIYQSVIGLLFMAGAFALAAIFGLLIFGDPSAILNPTLPTINQP